MRITFLCPHLRVAGGVRAILTYADRLAARGHVVTLVVPAPGPLRALRRRLSRDGPTWMPGLRATVRWVSRWSARALPSADITVATAWRSASVVAARPPAAGTGFYFVQHYESLYHGAPEVVDATYRLPLRKIAISTWLGEIIRERFAAPADVIVTPVDRALFHPVGAARATRPPRVLMLHHDYTWKGVADGLEAVRRAREHVRTLTLVGFGRKPPRGVSPYDEFHADPPQTELAALYSSSDIYLCPSWTEGLGMPAMEAMACGTALATYDNGGCRDYARDGITALVAPPRNVPALADALVRMLLDPLLRARIAAAGRDFVTTAFDWDRAVARLEALFTHAA